MWKGLTPCEGSRRKGAPCEYASTVTIRDSRTATCVNTPLPSSTSTDIHSLCARLLEVADDDTLPLTAGSNGQNLREMAEV